MTGWRAVHRKQFSISQNDPSEGERRDVGGVPLITSYSPLFPRSTMRGNKQMVSRLQSAGRLIERASDNREYNARVLVGGLDRTSSQLDNARSCTRFDIYHAR